MLSDCRLYFHSTGEWKVLRQHRRWVDLRLRMAESKDDYPHPRQRRACCHPMDELTDDFPSLCQDDYSPDQIYSMFRDLRTVHYRDVTNYVPISRQLAFAKADCPHRDDYHLVPDDYLPGPAGC